MPRTIELAVILDDVRWVDADLLVFKHAAGFHGADRFVAEALTLYTELSLDEIAKQIDADGYFVAPTNQVIQTPTVLFLKTPGLAQLYYRQIRDFATSAMNVSAKCVPEAVHVAMTIHGPTFGLDASVAFLAQMSGFITAIAMGGFPAKLQGISIVEKDPERAALLTMLLHSRFESESYARKSATGVVQFIDVEQVQVSHQVRTTDTFTRR
jgi:hypothetical protein